MGSQVTSLARPRHRFWKENRYRLIGLEEQYLTGRIEDQGKKEDAQCSEMP